MKVFFADDPIALAGSIAKAFEIGDLYAAAAISDDAISLQCRGDVTNGRALNAEHVCEKFLCDG